MKYYIFRLYAALPQLAPQQWGNGTLGSFHALVGFGLWHSPYLPCWFLAVFYFYMAAIFYRRAIRQILKKMLP